jgi:hypothetical protein
MLEKWIESHLVKRAKEKGGLAIKWTAPGFAGVPDRIVFLPGRILFVELKAPGQKATVLQNMVHGILRGLGADVRVVDSKEQVDEIFAETSAGADPSASSGKPLPVDRGEDGWW